MDRAEQRARPILFRRRGILTHRGTRINVDMDFAGRVALFVTQCNGERARLFSPLLPSPSFPTQRAHSPVRFPPRISTPASSFPSCPRSLCRDIQRDARQALSRIALSLSRSFIFRNDGNAMPKRRVRRKALSAYFVKKKNVPFFYSVYWCRSNMIYNAFELLNNEAQKSWDYIEFAAWKIGYMKKWKYRTCHWHKKDDVPV